MTKNQFKFDRDTVATNLKTPIVYDGKRMTIGETLDKLNELVEENQDLKKRINHLEDDLRYYKSKSASLETGLLDERRKNKQLHEENKV